MIALYLEPQPLLYKVFMDAPDAFGERLVKCDARTAATLIQTGHVESVMELGQSQRSTTPQAAAEPASTVHPCRSAGRRVQGASRVWAGNGRM